MSELKPLPGSNIQSILINDEDLISRERLGIIVRILFMKWAESQPTPKPSWLVPWTQLSEEEREIDRRIGEFLFRAGAEWQVMKSMIYTHVALEPSADFSKFLDMAQDFAGPGETGNVSRDEFYEGNPDLNREEDDRKDREFQNMMKKYVNGDTSSISELEQLIIASPRCELLGEFPDPCYRIRAADGFTHFCYPQREKDGRVPAATSPQYCNGHKPTIMTYPVETIRLLLQGETPLGKL
jgi:hypothetical protein